MIKSLLLVCTVLFFTACSSSMPYNYSIKTNELQFKISDKNYFTKKLQNPQYISTSDSCTNQSYLLKEKRYFIEYISLDTNCSWNGLASGYFEREFKSELKLKSMIAIERLDIKNYTFSTFKINDYYSLKTITIYSVFTDTFIIDFEGTLYNELLQKLKPTYKKKYKEMPRFIADYKYSMVKFNFFNSYFNRESSSFDIDR
jgi:hypothetical protein